MYITDFKNSIILHPNPLVEDIGWVECARPCCTIYQFKSRYFSKLPTSL